MRYCQGDWRCNNKKTHVTTPSPVYVGLICKCRYLSQQLHWPRGRRSFPWHCWCCENYCNHVFPFFPHYSCRVWQLVIHSTLTLYCDLIPHFGILYISNVIMGFGLYGGKAKVQNKISLCLFISIVVKIYFFVCYNNTKERSPILLQCYVALIRIPCHANLFFI